LRDLERFWRDQIQNPNLKNYTLFQVMQFFSLPPSVPSQISQSAPPAELPLAVYLDLPMVSVRPSGQSAIALSRLPQLSVVVKSFEFSAWEGNV
jgi:hypothetical protein